MKGFFASGLYFRFCFGSARTVQVIKIYIVGLCIYFVWDASFTYWVLIELFFVHLPFGGHRNGVRWCRGWNLETGCIQKL